MMFYVKMNKGKYDVRECTQSYLFEVLRLGSGKQISKAEYDYYCLLQWMREVKVKYGEDKVSYCFAGVSLCEDMFKKKGR